MLEITEAEIIARCINIVFPDYRAEPATRNGDPEAGDDEDYVVEVVPIKKGPVRVTWLDSMEAARNWFRSR